MTAKNRVDGWLEEENYMAGYKSSLTWLKLIEVARKHDVHPAEFLVVPAGEPSEDPVEPLNVRCLEEANFVEYQNLDVPPLLSHGVCDCDTIQIGCTVDCGPPKDSRRGSSG